MPSVVFDYTGSRQRWTVPANTKIVTVTIDGGDSGARQGGRVTGKMRVKAGQLLFLEVGSKGSQASNKDGGDPVYGGGGRGGEGTGPARPGGDGGGGASVIRYKAADGRIIAVAGGAGGASGDGGVGGRGGGDIASGELERGERGSPAPNGNNSGTAMVGNATGGTQNQGGKGGSSASGSKYRGADAKGRLSRGGRGGQAPKAGGNIYGGGGGGGGYYPGGGGQAGVAAVTKGGGGGGGSNYTDGLFSATSLRGSTNGQTKHGRITLTWDPAGGDETPAAPTDLKIDGVPIQDQLATRSGGEVTISGNPNDPDQKENVRLLVRYSPNKNFSNVQTVKGTYDQQDDRDKVKLTGLKSGTLYYVRIHTQQQKPRKRSDSFVSTSFWTNRPPGAPTLTAPLDNSTIPDTVNITFEWTHVDPDNPGDGQTAFEFQYRRAALPGKPAGELQTIKQTTTAQTITLDSFAGGGPLAPGSDYEWRVRTRDSKNKRGAWCGFRSFSITGTAIAPRPTSPKNDEAVRVDRNLVFSWDYVSKAQEDAQTRTDIRTRVIAARDGTTVTFDPADPASWTNTLNATTTATSYDAGIGTLTAGFKVEWQVRAASTGAVGPWSSSQTFWTVERPGALAAVDLVDSGLDHAGLGEGVTRFFIYDRGGSRVRGEIKRPRLSRWNRVRDDISNCTIYLDEFDEDTRDLISNTHSWRHEIVAFRRNGQGKVERVWEGPITRKSTSRSSIEIEAKDVMAYPYRRIMRQGYSDAYQEINGTQVGVRTVIQRATQILLNSLAYDDPNLIGYLTPMPNAGDSRSSGTRPDYSRMVWEELDDMAAVKGIDYTAIGRRIVINDTHHAIGKLPEMTDGDFSEPPVISEYGMSAAFYFAVTDGSGIWGASYPKGLGPGDIGPEGWIEQLASAYGEENAGRPSAGLTAKQLQARRDAFNQQAGLNVSGRWPIPALVRVPDNARLSPTAQVGINQLVPGVWIPLRANNGIDSVSQWQKLDSMTCEQDGSGEKVTVVMSPAPNGGQDPDADAAALEV